MAADAIPCLVCETAAPRFAAPRSGNYFSCGECGLVFQSPQEFPDAATERAYYDTHENDVADHGYRKFLARLTDVLFPRLPAGACGLDFGCGPGPALVAMAREAGFGMHGYDPLFAPHEHLLKRRYAFVTCTEAAEHFHRPLREFRRLDRLLVAGGWLGVMTAAPPDDRAAFERWHYHRDPTHVCFYRRATLRWLARRFGWRAEFPARDVALFFKPA